MSTTTEDPVAVEKRRARAATARAAFNASFATPEEKSAHMREIGLRGQAGRIGLRPADAAAVLAASRLLGEIVERYRLAERELPAAAVPEAAHVWE